jgi:hypothetical protein
MSLTAKQLSRSGARGKDLDALIGEQLRIIDDRLLRAGRAWGRNVVQVDLPTTLSLPGLAKIDAQRLLYSTILRSLQERGFETRLLLEGERATLYVCWMTDLDVAEVAAMNALIKANRVAPRDLATFLREGATPAPRAARQGHGEVPARLTVSAAGQVMHPRDGVLSVGGVRATPAAVTADELTLLGHRDAA